MKVIVNIECENYFEEDSEDLAEILNTFENSLNEGSDLIVNINGSVRINE